MEDAASAKLDEAVKAGRITEAQKTEALAKLSEHLDEMIAGKLPEMSRHHRGGSFVPGGAAIAQYLGLSQAQLRTQMLSGKSLGAIAKAQGKTVAGLKKVMTDEASAKLDEAVKAGRITAAQKTEMLSRLSEHLDDMIAGKRPDKGPGHGGFGPPPAAPPAAPEEPDNAAFAPVGVA